MKEIRLKAVVLCIAAVAPAGLGDGAASPMTSPPGPVCGPPETQKVAQTPSLLQLILNPERYDGCVVFVAGFLDYSYPTSRLFVSREDRGIGGALFGTFRVALRGASPSVDLEKLKRVRKGIVFLQGTVHSRPGNLPEIVNIEKFRGVQGGILGYDDLEAP
jgi:hypothetical protein